MIQEKKKRFRKNHCYKLTICTNSKTFYEPNHFLSSYFNMIRLHIYDFDLDSCMFSLLGRYLLVKENREIKVLIVLVMVRSNFYVPCPSFISDITNACRVKWR